MPDSWMFVVTEKSNCTFAVARPCENLFPHTESRYVSLSGLVVARPNSHGDVNIIDGVVLKLDHRQPPKSLGRPTVDYN